MKLLLANQATASTRRVYFFCVDATDGITAETGEAAGQPQISTDGGAWTNTGIGTLSALGNGYYYAELTQAAVLTAGTVISTRYKSAATAEGPGTTVQVVAFDPDDAAGLGLSRVDVAISTVLSAVSAIGSGTGAALNFAATTDNTGGAIEGVSFVGSQTLTYAATAAEDGSRHAILDSGGAPDVDIVYSFNVGAGRNAAKVTWKGIVTNADTVTFQAFNGSTWDTRATLTGSGGSSNVTKEVALLATHTGTGANAGRVLIRLTSTGQSSITVSTDEMLVAGVSVGQTVGYADGSIWIGGANANTTPYIDGTADNPCTYAAALTLSASTGLVRFHVRNGTTVTLTQTAANQSFVGSGWALALNGQAIDRASFIGADVSGTGTCTTQAEFESCHINAGTTTGPAHFVLCGFSGTVGSPFVAGSAGEFAFVDCFSEVAGSGTPYFTLSGAGGFNFRRWSGGSNVTLNNTSATLTMEVITGGGQTVALAGASVEVRGICRAVTLSGIASTSTAQINAVTGPVTLTGADGTVRVYGVTGSVADSRTGSPTLVDLSVSQGEIADAVWDEATAGHVDAGSTGAALTSMSAASIADAVWDEALAGHLSAGSTGDKLDSLASGGGSGSEILTVTVTVAGGPLEGVSVWAHGAGGAYLGSGVTDVNGQTTLNPGPGVITLTGAASGYLVTPGTVTVSSGQNATKEIGATAVNAPVAADPTLCTVYATLRTAAGVVRSGVQGFLRVQSLPAEVSGSFLGSAVLSATSGVDGVISWTVTRSALVEVSVLGHWDSIKFTVPDAAGLDISTL